MIALLPGRRRAREETLRRALAAEAERIHPAPGALDRIRARIQDQTAAPDAPEAAVEPNSFRELMDMETVTRKARELRPDDIITQHPDHPDDPAHKVWYRVDGWPRVSPERVVVDYTCRPEQVNGDAGGTLVLRPTQPVQVVPARAAGRTS